MTTNLCVFCGRELTVPFVVDGERVSHIACYMTTYADTAIVDGDVVSDDYQAISAWCPNGCGKTMQVVRPGKFQCSVCG